MSAATALTRPDTDGMLCVHRVFRESFALAPQLIGAVDENDPERIDANASFYANVLAFLHAHHEGEDELLWPKLLERCPAEAATVQHVAGQHQDVLTALQAAEERLAEWRDDPTTDRGATLAAALVTLAVGLNAHLDDEERTILPLVAQHITVEEWNELPGHAMRNFTGDKLWLIMGLIREQMTDQQRADMDAHMPPPVRQFWVEQGEALFTEFITAIRG